MTNNQPLQDGSPHCPQCGELAKWFISSSDVNRRISAEIFHYYQCASCQLIYLSPIPEDLSLYYRGGYQKIPSTLAELRAVARKEAYRLKPLLKYKRQGRLLEIGPWMGTFSSNAKDAGFQVSAIEMDAKCVEFMQKTVGVDAIQSDDPAAAMDSLSTQFDVIVMWHCLEHMARPWDVIRSVSARLAPGGVFLVAVPDIESHDFRTLREKWLHLDSPRHLCFYTAKGLERICAQYKLEKMEVTTSDELSAVLSKNAWGNLASQIFPVRLARRLLGRIMYFLARSRSGGHGSGLTGVFIRNL